MPESDGTFNKYERDDRPCPHCQVEGQHFVKLWESNDGAYEDEKHNCTACGKIWWVDGIDS
jgi:hypothetical protein